MRVSFFRSLVAAAALAVVPGCGADDGVEPLVQSSAGFSADNPFGVNAHGARDELLDMFLGIGIGWYRVDCEWSHNEPSDGVFDWSLTDRMVSTLKSRGAFVKLVAAYTPSWASGTNDTASPPKDPTRFVAYVREVAKRYRGQVDCVSVWNEPNLKQFWAGTKNQYLNDILVPSLKAIKEEAPEMVTCGPDLSSSGDERKDWMGPILDAAGPLLDVITHHQYDGDDKVGGRVNEIEKMHDFLVDRGYGDRPLWITEIGWDAPKFSREKQAQYLEATMSAMASRSSWWKKTFWYDSHGGGWGLLDGEAGTPTQSFATYGNVISNSPHAPGGDGGDPFVGLCESGMRCDSTPIAGSPDETMCGTTLTTWVCTASGWEDTGEGCECEGLIPPPPAGPDVLSAGMNLAPGAELTSSDGRFRLTYRHDGNLVLTFGEEELWWSGTQDTAPGTVAMQGDGNLVIYDAASTPVWSSGTQDRPGSYLILQSDGNLVVYAPDGSVGWDAGTCCH